jgi:hypothetical protein
VGVVELGVLLNPEVEVKVFCRFLFESEVIFKVSKGEGRSVAALENVVEGDFAQLDSSSANLLKRKSSDRSFAGSAEFVSISQPMQKNEAHLSCRSTIELFSGGMTFL